MADEARSIENTNAYGIEYEELQQNIRETVELLVIDDNWIENNEKWIGSKRVLPSGGKGPDWLKQFSLHQVVQMSHLCYRNTVVVYKL